MKSGKSEKCQNQFGRLAHYHYATPALSPVGVPKNVPAPYTSGWQSVKRKTHAEDVIYAMRHGAMTASGMP
jgi:hypothetical protein